MVGAEPSFSGVHVVRALLALGEGPVGRKRLVRRLGVGEGSVRTILKKLSSEGLISSSKGGHALSAEGKRKVASILDKIGTPTEVKLPQLKDKRGQTAVVVYKAAGGLSSVVGLRDIALKAGADGALILACEGGRLAYPGDVMGGRVPDVDGIDFGDGDVVVVGFAETMEKAEDGALSIALELTGGLR